MIQETLKKLKFNDKEIEIYLEVFRLGRATPSLIAKNIGINRTTIYSVAKNLIKKGILAEDLGGKYAYLVALPPDNLNSILEEQKKRLHEKETLVNEAIAELGDLPANIQFAIPKIRFIEESDLERYLYKQTDVWNKSISQYDKTWWGFQDHTFIDYYKKWTLDYWNKFQSSKGIFEKVLTNKAKIEKQMKKKMIQGRETLFWRANFSSSFWIAGDYIIMIYTQNRPFYLIEIYNPVMAHNLREVFKNLWKELKGKN